MSRTYRAANPGSGREARRAWRKANPECEARWRALHPESARNARARYLAAHPEYRRDNLARRQGLNSAGERIGPCDICGVVMKRVHDHAHLTGEFRGWLCGLCNVAIGMFRDDPELLSAAAEYLRRSMTVDPALNRIYGGG